MWIPGFIGRGFDREGASMVVAVARAVEKLSWAEVAWMMQTGGPDAEVEIDGHLRRFAIVFDWDGDPWLSDTWCSVLVNGVVNGRDRGFWHNETAQHWGEALPDTPPAPVAFDFAALVRRATAATSD